jgi:hypothetical protein
VAELQPPLRRRLRRCLPDHKGPERRDLSTRTAARRISDPPRWTTGTAAWQTWQTQNVLATRNLIRFDPANIPGCIARAWPACGANGVFGQYGGPNDKALGWEVPTQITFSQNNRWSENVYQGPSRSTLGTRATL